MSRNSRRMLVVRATLTWRGGQRIELTGGLYQSTDWLSKKKEKKYNTTFFSTWDRTKPKMFCNIKKIYHSHNSRGSIFPTVHCLIHRWQIYFIIAIPRGILQLLVVTIIFLVCTNNVYLFLHTVFSLIKLNIIYVYVPQS